MSDTLMLRAAHKKPTPFFEVVDDDRRRDFSIPSRKIPFAVHSDMEIEYIQFSFPGASKIREAGAVQHSRVLLLTFVSGVLVFLVGILLLVASIFLGGSVVKLVSSVFLALGSATVALAILRGQEIDERRI